MPRTKAADVIGKQLLRSATSIGANYRSACRAKSQADFISKIATVEEEADETIYWLELMIDSKLINGDFGFNLRKEASELTAIFSTSRKSARNNQSANRKL